MKSNIHILLCLFFFFAICQVAHCQFEKKNKKKDLCRHLLSHIFFLFQIELNFNLINFIFILLEQQRVKTHFFVCAIYRMSCWDCSSSCDIFAEDDWKVIQITSIIHTEDEYDDMCSEMTGPCGRQFFETNYVSRNTVLATIAQSSWRKGPRNPVFSTSIAFRVALVSSNETIGVILLQNMSVFDDLRDRYSAVINAIDWDTMDAWNVSYCLWHQYQHKGLMTLAVKTLLQKYKIESPSRTFYVEAVKTNVASQNVALRCGGTLLKAQPNSTRVYYSL